MCRRRPRERARFRARNNMPSAVLVPLRMPDNRFFEKPIRGHRACKSETFSPRRLRSAIRRQQACRRKAGTSKVFRLRSWLCGDPPDIRHRAGEKSTPARDRNNLRRTHRHAGLVRRHRRRQLNPDLHTRSPQSRAATPMIPSAPKRRRPGRAAPAQSAESGTEIPGTLAGGEKNLIHLAERDQKMSSANSPELSGFRRKHPSEMWQRGRNNLALRRRMGKRKRVRWRAEYGDPTSHRSSLGSGFAGDIVVPSAMERPGPCARDVTVNHGSKAALFEDRAHVDVDQEQSNRDESHAYVNQNCRVANEPETPWQSF